MVGTIVFFFGENVGTIVQLILKIINNFFLILKTYFCDRYKGSHFSI